MSLRPPRTTSVGQVMRWTSAQRSAVVGGGAAFVRKGLADGNARFIRFLSFYSFVLTAAYCLISYKTPWCLLSFWHGMILLAGVGAAVAVQAARNQASRAAVGLLAAVRVSESRNPAYHES